MFAACPAVGTNDAALRQCPDPKAFDAFGMHLAAYVLRGVMLNYAVNVVLIQGFTGLVLVLINGRPCFYFLGGQGPQLASLASKLNTAPGSATAAVMR